MQRAANASPKSTPSTPNSPPSKRQRLSYGSNASPATPSSDQRAIQAALAEEEMKRSAAVERQATEAGESRWMLSVHQPKIPAPSFRIVQASFAEIDSTNSDDDYEEGEYEDSPAGKRVPGRMSFGKVSPVTHVVFTSISKLANQILRGHRFQNPSPTNPPRTRRAPTKQTRMTTLPQL